MRPQKVASLLALIAIVVIPVFAEKSTGIQRPRVAMVVAPKDFADPEYFDQRALFDKKRIHVSVISTGAKEAISHSQAKVRVDLQIVDLKLDEFDVLDIVGGAGAKQGTCQSLLRLRRF